MRKIFYHPKTLKIMGMSDGGDCMQFPYITTEINYHATNNLVIELENNKPVLRITKGTL